MERSSLKTNWSVTTIAVIGVFIALEIILERLFAINAGDFVRLSFGKICVILIGMWFGPLAGALTGGLSDIIGALMQGYGINPLITLSAITWGVLPAIARKFMKGSVGIKLMIFTLSMIITSALCNLVFTPLGLVMYYGAKYEAIIGLRAIQFCIATPIYIIISWILYASPLTGMAYNMNRPKKVRA